MTQKIEQIRCKKCGEMMPKIRKEKFGYNNCIKCSDELPKVARSVMYGTGDNTWTDIVIMDQNTAKKIAEDEQQRENSFFEVEMLDFDEDEEVVSESIKRFKDLKSEDQQYDDLDIDDTKIPLD